MATITFRLADTEKADLETAARREGLSVSDYIRQTLDLRDQVLGKATADELWEKVARLEQIAGL